MVNSVQWNMAFFFMNFLNGGTITHNIKIVILTIIKIQLNGIKHMYPVEKSSPPTVSKTHFILLTLGPTQCFLSL